MASDFTSDALALPPVRLIELFGRRGSGLALSLGKALPLCAPAILLFCIDRCISLITIASR
jgi:hypothetical protein